MVGAIKGGEAKEMEGRRRKRQSPRAVRSRSTIFPPAALTHLQTLSTDFNQVCLAASLRCAQPCRAALDGYDGGGYQAGAAWDAASVVEIRTGLTQCGSFVGARAAACPSSLCEQRSTICIRTRAQNGAPQVGTGSQERLYPRRRARVDAGAAVRAPSPASRVGAGVYSWQKRQEHDAVARELVQGPHVLGRRMCGAVERRGDLSTGAGISAIFERRPRKVGASWSGRGWAAQE